MTAEGPRAGWRRSGRAARIPTNRSLGCGLHPNPSGIRTGGLWFSQELHLVGTGWNSVQPPHGCGAAGGAVTRMGLICWERRGVCIAFLVAQWFKPLMTSRHYLKGSGLSQSGVLCLSVRGKKKAKSKTSLERKQ